ncbi:pyridoxal-dependent decarboxylase, partial [Streptomyces sp. ND04-05B]|uniref:pyridoxal phosphate-dependent decarboxylase family protein n=1 Tax=Streptomyces sp. ND04-05B TaxID=3028693 RepID=UPI0029AB0CD4
PTGTMDLPALREALIRHEGPLLVTATAGTTDTGHIDPLDAIADLTAAHGAELHIDAAYGGPLLFSPTHRHLVHGLQRAHSVTLDLHKLGWQPASAGILAVPHHQDLAVLHHHAPYLNAGDDTDAGLPDLLGRSLRTTRRPDALKIAVTLQALGRDGLADLIDRTLAAAHQLADLITATPHLELYERPTISTVLFRPTGADDTTVATIRRTLLTRGHAVLGRARTDRQAAANDDGARPYQPGEHRRLAPREGQHEPGPATLAAVQPALPRPHLYTKPIRRPGDVASLYQTQG